LGDKLGGRLFARRLETQPVGQDMNVEQVGPIQPLQHRPIRRRRFTSNIIPPLALLIDIICLFAAAPLALLLYPPLFNQPLNEAIHVTPALIAGFGFLLIRLSRDAYRSPFGTGQGADQGIVFDYLIAASLSIVTIWQMGQLAEFSRGLMVLYVATVLTLLMASRFIMRRLVWRLAKSGFIGQRLVLYGADRGLVERAHRLLELERLPHLSIVGIADDRARGSVPGIEGAPMIGGLPELVELTRRGEVDQVLIAIADISQERLDQVLEALSAVSVDVCLIPRESLILTGAYQVNFIGSLPILSLWQRPLRDINGIAKTLEDKVLAGLGLMLLSPVLLLTALAVKLSSPGPIFFSQTRFGFNNVEIKVLKFRSMYVDTQDVSGARRTRRGDARVTPVGRIIRRLSIDELPQLWNVLKGDMSLVGPRPHATMMKVGDRFYFDAVRGYAARHRVKPGLTGLAQVRGLRGEIDTIDRARKRVDYDRFYIENWSLMLDLRILALTVAKIVFDKDAY
jgi:polysaccharide biosynthesis protein PslA